MIARAPRKDAARDRALADEIRKLELELGVAKKGQAVANREKKASQKGYSVSIDEEDPHARSAPHAAAELHAEELAQQCGVLWLGPELSAASDRFMIRLVSVTLV